MNLGVPGIAEKAVGILLPRKHAFPGAKPAFQNNGTVILQAFWEIQRIDFSKEALSILLGA